MKNTALLFLLLIPFYMVAQKSNIKTLDSVPIYSKDFLNEYVEVQKKERKEQRKKISTSSNEAVPVYPGCEKGNNEKKRKCMSQKISKFFAKEFNVDLARNLGLTGRQRISVIFKIDTLGRATEIRARAPHQKLEREAIRLVKMLPIIKPGTQDGKKVIVPYSLPIIFSVN